MVASLRTAASAAALILMVAAPARAAVTVDPDLLGGAFSFGWSDGLGRIDSISEAAESEWSLTLASATTVTFQANDAFFPGDEFGLVLGGTATAWSEAGVVGDYFRGVYSDLLGPGTYIFSLDVTRLGSDSPSGTAFAAFDLAPIPLPAAAPLLLGALAGLGLAARRRGA